MPLPVPDPAPVPAPASATAPSGTPGCLARLVSHHVAAEPVTLPEQPDSRCTVAEPVKLTGLVLADGSAVKFPDAPSLACATAETFSAYARELLAPLVRGSFGTGLASVATGPGLECRPRDNIKGARLSAHGQGLAVDIATLTLSDGRIIAVGSPETETVRAFEAAARAAGCGYFHTALGPGADAYHKTHWHFDLEPRGAKGNSKFCQ